MQSSPTTPYSPSSIRGNHGIVIVGGGQASVAFIHKYRALGGEAPLTLLSEEAFLPYERPPLSKGFLTEEMAVEKLRFVSDDYYHQHQVEVGLQSRVTSLNPHQKIVSYRNAAGRATNLAYDKLILASGGRPRQLPLSLFLNHKGEVIEDIPTPQQGLFHLRGLAEAKALKQGLETRQNLVLIGGGFIGLEVAASARKLGKQVTVVEATPRLLNRVVSPETALYITEIHRKQGVTLRLNAQLESIGLNRQGQVANVDLADGSSLPCDGVLVAIGILANDTIAAQAGLPCQNGIITDHYGCTEDESIYAMGDCALFPYGSSRIKIESVGNAIEMGELVAKNLLATPSERIAYQPKPWFWSNQYDYHIQMAGLNQGYRSLVMRKGEQNCSFWYYDADDKLLAVDAINDARAYMVARKLLEAGLSLSPDKARDPMFDLKQALKPRS